MHLFDINIPGRVKFCESASLSAGDRPVVFKTEFGKVGLGICYDLRFPELAVNAAQAGCFMIVYPGAFTETTGPLHWELLLRSRAVDNQMFVAGVSGSLDTSIPDGYRAWGHSMMVNPMGVVIAKAERTEAILMVDLCLAEVEETRNSIPITRQKRLDLYSQAAFFNN